MVEAGLISAIGIILLLMRFDIRKVTGYAAFADVTISGVLVWMFIGTYAGMMTGLFAGVLVSLYLHMMKRIVGAKRLAFIRYKGELVPRVRWRMQ